MPQPISSAHATARQTDARWLILVAMCFGLFLINLDTSVVNVALPTIQQQFGASTASLQWIINGYLLTLAVLLVTAGKLCDLYGRKRIYLIGLAIFTLASLGCGLAPSLSWLIGFRALQGLGGSIVLAGGLSIISITFTGKQLASAIGIWSGISGLALAAGPTVGGALVQYTGWRSMFLINIPFGILGFFIVLWAMKEMAGKASAARIDVAGIATLTPGIFALILACIEGQSWGWTSLPTLGLIGSAGLLLLAFVRIELRQAYPMVPFRLFHSYAFSAASIISFILLFAMFSSIFFITLLFQDVLGYSALLAGLGTTPMTVMIMLCSPVAGRLAGLIGERPVIIAGLSIFIAGLILFILLLSSHVAYGALVIALLLIGIGNGSSLSLVAAVAMGTVEHGSAGVASGIVNMARQLGGVFGVAILGTIFATRAQSLSFTELAQLPISAQARNQLAQEATSGKHTTLSLHATAAITKNAQDAMLTGTIQGMQLAVTIAASLCILALLLAMRLKRPVEDTLAEDELPELLASEISI